MKSDTETLEHGDWSESQTLVRDEAVCEASHGAASVLHEPIECAVFERHSPSFDHLVGEREQPVRNLEAERLEIDYQLGLVDL